jgi:SAM-dependent methyltransferase
MTPLLHVCDAVNIHLFEDATWDAVHASQVAEHWRPELVPLILRELARVVKPGGLFYCALDTEELFAREARDALKDDPTHICVRPLVWWHRLLEETGWRVCSEEYVAALLGGENSFQKRYNWDYFIARRV